MHDEPAGVVREPDLFAAELEQRLDVRARSREDAPPGELRVDGAMHVAGGDPAHLRMGCDDLAERLLVVQTLTTGDPDVTEPPDDLPFEERHRLREPGWPSTAFVEHRLAGDPTNWWVPNEACVEAMLRSCGLEVAARPGHELWICRPLPSRHASVDLRALNRR